MLACTSFLEFVSRAGEGCQKTHRPTLRRSAGEATWYSPGGSGGLSPCWRAALRPMRSRKGSGVARRAGRAESPCTPRTCVLRTCVSDTRPVEAFLDYGASAGPPGRGPHAEWRADLVSGLDAVALAVRRSSNSLESPWVPASKKSRPMMPANRPTSVRRHESPLTRGIIGTRLPTESLAVSTVDVNH